MNDVKVKNAILAQVHPYRKKEVPLYDEGWIRLDRNESQFGISPRVREAVLDELKNISKYPENTGIHLRRSLARYYQIDPECILIGNGSFELLWLIASVYLDDKAESLLSAPTFGWYKAYGQLFGRRVIEIPLSHYDLNLDGLLERITDRTKLIWLCNPNNPTGRYIPADRIKQFLEKIPSHILVVIDEAYLEFIDNYTPHETISLIKSFDNVILLRTFSKFYGLASLRIGYALASPQIIQNLFQFRIPPNHSRIAEAAAAVSIEDIDFQKEVQKQVKKERSYLYRKLLDLGIVYLSTQTNFLVFQIPDTNSEEVKRALAETHVLVKSGKVFEMDHWLRLTVGDRETNRRVIAELGTYIEGRSAEANI